MVAVVLVFLLLVVLIDRLQEAQRASEQIVVEMEVATLRAELQMVVASHTVRGEEARLLAWVGRNPAELARGGAAGASLDGAPGFSGTWRWNAGAGALSYVFLGGGCVQLRVARVRPGQAEGWSLGAGLLLVPTREEKCG